MRLTGVDGRWPAFIGIGATKGLQLCVSRRTMSHNIRTSGRESGLAVFMSWPRPHFNHLLVTVNNSWAMLKERRTDRFVRFVPSGVLLSAGISDPDWEMTASQRRHQQWRDERLRALSSHNHTGETVFVRIKLNYSTCILVYMHVFFYNFFLAVLNF